MKLSSRFAESSVLKGGAGGLRWFAVLCTFLLLGSLVAFAQEATVVGTVTDPSGSVLPNVTITLTNVETGQARTLTTNDAGQYVAPGLRIGHYNIKATASGFTTAEKTGIVLNVGDRSRIDFDLKVGGTQEHVTVEANAVAVQTDTGEVSGVITDQQVSKLATNGRSIYTLVNLTPGASSIQGDAQMPTPVGGDAAVSFNGQRMSHNIYLMDGGENLDRGGAGTFSVMPSLESIAEFRTLTSNYDAQYGLSSAATMTTVLKSGTSKLHAQAWEFGRNDALQARNYFTRSPAKIAELRMNIFGFNVGGQLPVAKSHPTFFFYNMEWRKIIQGQTLNQTVPLTSTYGGNLGTTNINVPSAANAQASVLFARCPGGVAPAGIVQGSQFPNNTIPACMLDPNAQALLAAGIFPAPTSGTQFSGGNNVPTNVREEITRIDHQFSDKFSVFGHFVAEQITQGFGTTMWSGDNVPTIGNTFGNPSYSGVVHATHTISPTLLNEIAFNYNGNRINIIPDGLVTAPAGFTFNRIFTGPNELNRIPSIALNNNAQYTANWTPWRNKADDYQIRDDVSWTKGAHQLKMGASWALYKKVQDLFANTQGNFSFNGKFTGDSFADYLLGLSNQYNEGAVKDSGHWNNVSWAAYLQDNWRVNNRLTLNLGVRWDGAPHTYEANHRMSNFYPNLYSAANAALFNDPNCNGTVLATCNPNQIAATSPGLGPSPNPILAGNLFYVNGMGIDGRNGVPKGLVNSHWAAFGPRIGFAYDVTGQGKTVIRGGFGMMYERIQGNDVYNMGPNVPFSSNPSFNDVSLSDPKLNVPTGTALTVPIVPGDVTGLDKNYPFPTSYQYSFGIQQQLGAKTVFNISYVGNQNRNQNYWQETNLPSAALLPALQASSTPMKAEVPFRGYGSVRLAFNGAKADYNSLQTSLRGKVAKDLDLQFGYTYSRSADPTTGNGGNGFDLNNVSNPYVGWRYDWGPSVFDRTHIAFVNYVYDIPLLKNSSNKALKTAFGGWQLSGIISMQSGAPIDVRDGANNVASIFANGLQNRPNLTAPISYVKQPNANGFQWFSTASFTNPVDGQWGTLGHNALRGAGRDNWNMSLFKNFVFSEERGSRLEFRADCFNMWNHTQFGGGGQNGGLGSVNTGAATFGTYTNAFDPRAFQLGLKLIY